MEYVASQPGAGRKRRNGEVGHSEPGHHGAPVDGRATGTQFVPWCAERAAQSPAGPGLCFSPPVEASSAEKLLSRQFAQPQGEWSSGAV